jgi:hypothetical protein
MYSSISRKERLLIALYKATDLGRFSITATLYKSEIKGLRKQGFKVQPSKDSNVLVECKISWNFPFYGGIPAILQAYIDGEISIFDAKDITLSQKLYVIAAHNNNSKKKSE